MALAGCGTVSSSRSKKPSPVSSTQIAKELPCGKLPPEANCPGPAPAKPVPMSPDGPAHAYKSDYLSTEEIISENGVYEVAATAPGTFALTGTVVDSRPQRPPYDLPIVGATVTFSSLSGPALAAPPGGDVSVATKTGQDGAFAFIDLPAARSGSCYRMTIVAPGVGRYESVDLLFPEVDFQSVELGTGSAAALARACAGALDSGR